VVFEKFVKWMQAKAPEPRVLMAYNGYKFDFRLLIASMHRCGIPLIRLPVHYLCDAIHWVKAKAPKEKLERDEVTGLHCYKLPSVHQALVGKKLMGAHDALEDCIGTIEVCKLLKGGDEFVKPFWNWANEQLRSVACKNKRIREEVDNKLQKDSIRKFMLKKPRKEETEEKEPMQKKPKVASVCPSADD
jgi:hypothetical protein